MNCTVSSLVGLMLSCTGSFFNLATSLYGPSTSYLAFNVLCHHSASDNAFLRGVNNNYRLFVKLSLFEEIGPWVEFIIGVLLIRSLGNTSKIPDGKRQKTFEILIFYVTARSPDSGSRYSVCWDSVGKPF